jgi:ATP-dependent NAD(P)H-hydrate dehydratase
VFAQKSAAKIIKVHYLSLDVQTYSPDLIVHPIYPNRYDEAEKRISDILPSIHTVLVGPGMGREPDVLEHAVKLINESSFTVVDADGLYAYKENINRLKQSSQGKLRILTPNEIEFRRLCSAMVYNNLLKVRAYL